MKKDNCNSLLGCKVLNLFIKVKTLSLQINLIKGFSVSVYFLAVRIKM